MKLTVFGFCVTEERLTLAIAKMVGIFVFVKLSWVDIWRVEMRVNCIFSSNLDLIF